MGRIGPGPKSPAGRDVALQSHRLSGMGPKGQAVPRPHPGQAAVAIPNLRRAGTSEIPGVGGEVCAAFLGRERGASQASPRRLQLLPNMLRLVTAAGREIGKPGKQEGMWGAGGPWGGRAHGGGLLVRALRWAGLLVAQRGALCSAALCLFSPSVPALSGLGAASSFEIP